MKNRESNLRTLRTERHLTQKQVASAVQCTEKTYQQYEKACSEGVPKTGLDFTLISALADFFGVSIDYVLGRSSCRSVDNELIHQKTGLSDASIENLARLKKTVDDRKGLADLISVVTAGGVDTTQQVDDTLDDLNAFFSSSSINVFANGLHSLLHTGYTVPAVPTNKGFVYQKGIKGQNFLNLANPDYLPDIKAFPLDSSFLKSVALMQLQEYFSDFEQEYKKAHKKKGV